MCKISTSAHHVSAGSRSGTTASITTAASAIVLLCRRSSCSSRRCLLFLKTFCFFCFRLKICKKICIICNLILNLSNLCFLAADQCLRLCLLTHQTALQCIEFFILILQFCFFLFYSLYCILKSCKHISVIRRELRYILCLIKKITNIAAGHQYLKELGITTLIHEFDSLLHAVILIILINLRLYKLFLSC